MKAAQGVDAFYGLSDNNYQWDESSTRSQFSGDGYHVTTAIKNYTFFCNASATNFSNFAYEVQMTLLKGDSGGLVFRANADNATFYYFRIDSAGSYRLIIFTGHTGAGILQNGTISAFHQGLGKSNLLAAVANGNHLSLYVNHVHITDVLENTYSHGQIGVAVSTADHPPAEAVFTNAKVWKF